MRYERTPVRANKLKAPAEDEWPVGKLLEFWRTLVEIERDGHPMPGKFAVAVIANIDRISEVVKSVLDSTAVPDDLAEFDRQWVELCKRHAKKGVDGEPLVDPETGEYVARDPQEFLAVTHQFLADHREENEARQRWQREQVDRLKQTVKVRRMSRVKPEDLPPVSIRYVRLLSPMILR